jgi:hypothetical protein
VKINLHKGMPSYVSFIYVNWQTFEYIKELCCEIWS